MISAVALAPELPNPFFFLGGPLHQLGRRIGLVRRETNTILLGVALGWGLWLLIVAVALMVRGTD
jgi:hypothetical protein